MQNLFTCPKAGHIQWLNKRKAGLKLASANIHNNKYTGMGVREKEVVQVSYFMEQWKDVIGGGDASTAAAVQ